MHVARWTTGQVVRDGQAQKWLLEQNWATRKQDLSHVTFSRSQSWDGASLSVHSSHLNCDLPFEQRAYVACLAGPPASPSFFNPRTSCLVLTSCDTSPGSTAAALLSILAFFSCKTPTLGGLIFLFE